MRRYVLKHATPGTPDDKPDQATINIALSAMPAHFSMLDRAVSSTGYLVGDTFTLADVPILFFMTKLPESAAILQQVCGLNVEKVRPTWN